jgi:hypothetical protein
MRQPTQRETEYWIDATLRNDETSTDEELLAYFIQNGVSPEDAAAAVATRPEKMGRI